MILQNALFEQEEKTCVATEEALLIVAEQHIELTVGQGCRFIHKIFTGRRGRDHFKRHVHSVYGGCVRNHWQEARHEIDGVLLGVYAQDVLPVAGIAKLLCVDQGRIEYGGKLFLPVQVCGVGPVDSDVGQIDAVVVHNVFCGADTEYLEISLCFGIALGCVADQVGQAHHAVTPFSCV